jgi:probable DNA repair protein
MNPWQERFLWVRVLESSEQGEWLLNLPAAGRLAAEAQQIVSAYELADALWQPGAVWEEETRVFMGWARSFKEICDQERWLDSAHLEACLAESLAQGAIPTSALPSTLTLVGFSELTPAQRRLLDVYQSLGLAVESKNSLTARPGPGAWCRTVAKDQESELRAAALWIRGLLEQAGSGPIPRIALVVPDLGTCRPLVTRILDEVLQPRHLLPHATTPDSLYDISLGMPLSRWPVVADALSLLELDGGWQSLPDLGVLFHSPFVGEAESERDPRALLEARLLRDGAFKVSMSRVLYRASRTDAAGSAMPTTCPLLSQRLESVLQRLQGCQRRMAPSRWAEELKAILDLYGWPGERTLNSSEFQTVVRWTELLAQLGSLDRIYPLLDRRGAVAALRRMAEETVFQPRLPHGPVEVLGYLEAAGLPFDHVWLAGMDDAAWPRSASPNPYLPLVLQRAHGVPHSSADRELDFAVRLTRQLLESSPRGVASCAATLGDQSLRPSRLVHHLPEVSPGQLPLASVDPLPILIYESRQLERVVDPGPPQVAEGRRSVGGTSIFKLQSACPFRAFASLRLHARPLSGVEGGLDWTQRGKMLHTVLEGFWRRARTSRALHDWPEDLREEALAEAVEEALLEGRRERPDVLTGAFLDLERRRLQELAARWLELEASRGPFVVRDVEKAVEMQLGEVRFRVVVDRIDLLPNGDLVVIDYKTGSVSYRDWLGQRPAEPQMPLYCVASPERVAALVFARLKPGEMSFTGIGRVDDLLPGVDSSELAGDVGMPWLERQQEWAQVLTDLAAQFHQGIFAVDPLQRRKTCRNCRLETLCRIDELESQR